MTIIETIETVFDIGCGVKTFDVLASKRFADLSEACSSLSERYSDTSDEGVALRAGHLVMGKLLNSRPEAEAIKQAKLIRPEFGCGIELRPLIQCLGESLVFAATECLPEEAMELAEEWKGATVERQIEIARRLYFLFRSQNQGFIGEETMTRESAYRKIQEKISDRLSRKSGVDDILPRLYGKWHGENQANCQGKTQMLVAFARLAGANVMAVNSLRRTTSELETARHKIVTSVDDDMRQRGLFEADRDFSESRAGYQLERLFDEDMEDFHIGAALELSDGRWILIDAHGLAWGVFSDQWQMSTVYQTLCKYGEVLPGLQLTRDDAGENQARIEARAQESLDLIARSQRLEEQINEGVTDLMELIELVEQSDDFDVLVTFHHDAEGEDYPAYLESPDSRKFAVMNMVACGLDNLFNPVRVNDPAFLKRQIREWLTFYHCVAINHLGSQQSDNGEIIHPCCEFGVNPEYHLAVSAINSLLVRYESDADRRFFIDYTFDQLMLYNCLPELHRGSRAIGEAAVEAIRTLPFVHENIQNKLGRAR